jgi:hypothetical protein
MCNYVPPESCIPRMACPPTDMSCFKLNRQGADRMPMSLWMPNNWPDRAPVYIKITTMDAKYQAWGVAARERHSLCKALRATALLSSAFPLGVPVVIRCDNQAALSLCQDRKEGQRMKRFDIIHHFARDHMASGKLLFVFCKSEENMSDCLT